VCLKLPYCFQSGTLVTSYTGTRSLCNLLLSVNRFVCVQGKVEVELQLVTAEEMELNPVGPGRNEPEPLSAPK